MYESACVFLLRSLTLHTVSDTEELNVLLKEGSRTTTLWWLSGNHGDLWQHGEVTVGRVSQDFTILFEASRTFNKPGHVAIDDIGFTNCTLPGRIPKRFCFFFSFGLFFQTIYIHEIFLGFLFRGSALLSRGCIHMQQQCVCGAHQSV